MFFVKKTLKPKTGSAPATGLHDEPEKGVVIEGQAVPVADAGDAASPAKGEKSGGLFSRLRAGKPASAEEVVDVEPEPTVVAKAPPGAQDTAPDAGTTPEVSAKAEKLLGKFGRKAEGSKPTATAKTPGRGDKKAAKAPKASKPSKKAIYIGADVDESTTVWWELSNGQLVQMAEAPSSGRAVLFSRKDTRLPAAKPLSYSDAVSLGFQESGEDVAIVNASRTHGVVYSTSPRRIEGLGLEIVPGGLVLEAVARANNLQAPCVVGFDLPGSNGRAALLVIGAVLQKAGLAKFQLTLNTDNRQFTLNQFVAQQKGLPDNAPATLFGLDELVAESSKLPAYPREQLLFGGVPKSIASWIGAGLAGALAAGGIVAYGQFQLAKAGVDQLIAKTVQEERVVKAQIAGLVEARIPALIERSTLDTGTVFAEARALWTPRAKVALDAQLAGDIKATVTFYPSGEQSGKASHFLASEKEITDFTRRTEIGACRRDTLSMNGASNEIVATYLCENPVVVVPGYSLD